MALMEDEPLDWSTAHPDALRRVSAERASKSVAPSGVAQQNHVLPGALEFVPLDTVSGGTMIYFHGGGFVTGSPAERAASTSWIAHLTGWRVVSCPYRLAPEQGWRAQREDAASAMTQIVARAVRGERIAVAADSAGVSVALWGLSVLDETVLRRISAVIFFYGAYGGIDLPSIKSKGSLENGLSLAEVRKMYDRLGPDWIVASTLDLDPRLFSMTVVGSDDPLVDDSLAWYAARWRDEAKATLLMPEGLEHGFLHNTHRDPRVRKCIGNVARFLAEIPTVQHRGT